MIVAACQLNSIVGDFAGNCRRIKQASEKASLEGAGLTVTPELSVWGYPPRDLSLYPRLVRVAWEHIHELAIEVATHPPLLVGTVDLCESLYTPRFHNVAVLLSNGKAKVVSLKKYLPYYDVFDEPRYFSPGSGPALIDVGSEKVIVSVCEDLWKSLDVDLSKQHSKFPNDFDFPDASLIVNMSASPFYAGKQNRRDARLTEQAREYGKSILFVNQCGANDGLIFDGSGSYVSPVRGVIAQQPSFCEDIAVFDTNKLEKEASAPLQNKRQDKELEDVRQALVMGVRDYVAKSGFKKTLIGVSGGIDSAVVACVACEALGPENVIGVVMPSEYNSPQSAADAVELAENLGLKILSLPIDKLKDTFLSELSPLFEGLPVGVAEENLQSRIRGTLLMALSNKHDWLLLTTGNKSEMAVGYCTIYGDMNGALAVIGDVWKTDVFRLAELFPAIPESILTKPPSAELRHDQKDQDSLPEYDVLDKVLKALIEEFKTPQELIEMGHDDEVVARVSKLLSSSEFKRRQAAPVLKVSPRCLSLGWRMPIAARKL